MDDERGSTSTTSTPPPASTTSPASAPSTATSTKNPLLSRRRFLQGALAASTILAAASIGASGQILGPLIPPTATSQEIISWTQLNQQYQQVKDKPEQLHQPINYSEFFYYPYDSSVSPYYKNVIARLPDPLVNPNPQYSSDPILKHVSAFNVTCVHLRCLVNPGYDTATGEFRLQCPCHGSQYRLVDGVPVAGPAYDLGLNPLPNVQLSVDANGKISAVGKLNGEPGIGRTQ